MGDEPSVWKVGFAAGGHVREIEIKADKLARTASTSTDGGDLIFLLAGIEVARFSACVWFYCYKVD